MKLSLNESFAVAPYDNTQLYNPLPFFSVRVVNTKSIINVPSEIECSSGGTSLPLMISTDTPPFTAVTIAMNLTESNSVGLNITKAASSKTLTSKVAEDFLEFFCEADVAVSGGEILYYLSGVDAENYVLSSEKVTVKVNSDISINLFGSGYPTLIYHPSTTPLNSG